MPLKSEFSAPNAYRYDRRSPVRWLWSHAWRYKGHVVAAMLLFVGAHLAYSMSPVLVGRAAEEILHPETPGTLAQIALAVLAVLLFDGLSMLTGSYVIEVIAKRVEADSREELYASLLGKDQTFHDRQRTGDLMARATDDMTQLSSMIMPGLSLIYETVLAIVVPLLYIASISREMLLVPLLFVATYVVAVRRYTQQLNPITRAQREQFGTMNSGLEETISGIEIVKASAQEPLERQKYAHNARRYRDLFVEQGYVEARYLPLLLYGIALALTFLHATWLYSLGRLSLANIIGIMGLMTVLRFPTFISIFTFSLVQVGLASAERILAIIRAETDLDENPGGHTAPVRGEIVFEDVSFGYGGAPVLDNLSFRIAPGQTVAIVGQTGAGKSTLTKLVNRTYDVTRGRILVDGVDVRDWNLTALRSQISTIEQDIFLFSRTVAENIAFGAPGASSEAIERAAREAQAHDFILRFNDGYSSKIGERGVTLSGGQRQRLALARAFLSDPRILILDDSTSAIDSATEDEIQRAIQRAQQGRTTLLITHRLSQIRWADVILVLDQGRLAAVGSHEELLRTSLAYRRIFARYDVALPPLEREPEAALQPA